MLKVNYGRPTVVSSVESDLLLNLDTNYVIKDFAMKKSRKVSVFF